MMIIMLKSIVIHTMSEKLLKQPEI